MNNNTYNEYLRETFIQSLISFSKGDISVKEANDIADQELICSDYYDDSPIAHKGPRWQALDIARHMGYTKYPII